MNDLKRVTSFFLLLLIFFNPIGYLGLFLLVKKQLTTPILQRIETNSNEIGGNLILVIPLELSHASASEEYTRVDGEITYQREVYRLVKQKYFKNMIYVVCIKDEQREESVKTMADYSTLFSGQDAGRTNSNIKILNSFSKYYTKVTFSIRQQSISIYSPLKHNTFIELYQYMNANSIFHPPLQS